MIMFPDVHFINDPMSPGDRKRDQASRSRTLAFMMVSWQDRANLLDYAVELEDEAADLDRMASVRDAEAAGSLSAQVALTVWVAPHRDG